MECSGRPQRSATLQSHSSSFSLSLSLSIISTSENLVLTASEDKTLHVVSLRTNSSVQT
jgi:hypothetical protein